LSFCPHNFHFPNPPEPPSTCHHIVDEELKEAPEGTDHKGFHRHIPLPTIAITPPAHMIDDGHCKAIA